MTTLLPIQAMGDLSQVTTSQPPAACSIVLLENTVPVSGPEEKTQTKPKALLPQPPVAVWVFSILLRSQAILADTTELPDAAIAHIRTPSYRDKQVAAVTS